MARAVIFKFHEKRALDQHRGHLRTSMPKTQGSIKITKRGTLIGLMSKLFLIQDARFPSAAPISVWTELNSFFMPFLHDMISYFRIDFIAIAGEISSPQFIKNVFYKFMPLLSCQRIGQACFCYQALAFRVPY